MQLIIGLFFKYLSNYNTNLCVSSIRQCNSSYSKHFIELSAINKQGVWPPCSPAVSWCNFYLFGMLKAIMYGNNPHTEDDL